MVKRPAEIFGFPIEINSEAAKKCRKNHFCPFTNLMCNKQSRLIDYPMGVCSVTYGDEIIALCPRRFLQEDIIFTKIADHYFENRNNLLILNEVGLTNVGTFDYVMIKHKPLKKEIDDFIIIEYQTGQTTGTGKLVQALEDFMNGKNISKSSYGFGLNLADIWKRTFTQILNKGIILEQWGNKIYWVVQIPVYKNFTDRYNIKNLTFKEDENTIFFVCDLEFQDNNLMIVDKKFESSTINNLFNAFRTNTNIPSKKHFISNLQKKIQKNVVLNINLKR